jgi:hypothetical protein
MQHIAADSAHNGLAGIESDADRQVRTVRMLPVLSAGAAGQQGRRQVQDLSSICHTAGLGYE